MSKFVNETAEMDCCVHCNQELSKFERNRSECWDCREKISETYSDDLEVNDDKSVIQNNP